MSAKRISVWVWAAGIAMIVAAVAWWGWFYSAEIIGTGAPLGSRRGSIVDALGCLASMRGSCAVITGLAAMGGRAAYNPAVLWIGIAILWLGATLRIAAEVQEWRQHAAVRLHRLRS